MQILKILSKEMTNEAQTTREMLNRIPDNKFDWQPHEKSMNIERLSNHIAELPGWVTMVLNTEELDFLKSPYVPTTYANKKDLLSYFEETLKAALASLEQASEDQLSEPWTLRQGEIILSQGSKLDMIRMSYSQIVHHRAQLGVYLRLLNVPIPGSYGPSADEKEA